MHDSAKYFVQKLAEIFITVDKQQCDARRIVAELGPRLGHISSNISMESQAIETLKKTIEKQEKEAGKVKVDQAEIDAKQKIVEELEKQRDELSEQTESVKSRQAEIQSHLDGLFRELVQCHRDEAKDAHSKRTKLEKDMAKEAANSANSGRDIAKCDANIERFDKEIEKKQQMCEGLNENVRSEEDVETKKKTLEEKEEKRKELEKEFETMNNRRSELSEAETKLEEQLKTVNEEMMAMKAKMQDQRARVEDIETKLSGLQLNRIPRFQFLIESTRPEDLDIQLDEEMQVDENQRPEDVEKQKRHMANVISDQVYAMEFGMRQKVLENTETVENIDGPKTVPVELLTEEKVREISDRDAEELQFRVKQCEQQLDVLKQKVDLSCIETYIQKVKHFNEETIKMAVVTDNLRRHNRELQRIKKMRLDEFHSAFEFIGKHLVAVYKMLTDGGDAKLEYIDKDDPFNQGISFMVRPAKKAWKQIQYLSGGEKTLSSLALIFALHMFRPTPFYVMDEIDAALDYRNVSIIAQYVRQKTENAQFIIISLRNNMFELANRLVGIYKVDGCTQNVAIDPLAVCQQAKLISESLGQATCTLPDEVSQRFNDTMSRQTKELTAQEKQYPNFPSSSEISKAEKIVSVEGRVRKELNGTTLGATTSVAGESRAQSKTSERPVSTVRPESRLHQMRIPAPRLVQRASTAAGANASTSISTSLRTSRLERRNESDE
uniref:Structural maintenance of chromosomes protein 4 n=1 Tax=Caenorhabditis japonica TaxID=281687 RepID=A0A8R1INJ2_CAEJA